MSPRNFFVRLYVVPSDRDRASGRVVIHARLFVNEFIDQLYEGVPHANVNLTPQQFERYLQILEAILRS